MKIVVGAECTPIRAGIEARSPELRVCGHGSTKASALDSLRVSVRAWAVGLELADPRLLSEALNASGVTWSPDGDSIEIEIEDV